MTAEYIEHRTKTGMEPWHIKMIEKDGYKLVTVSGDPSTDPLSPSNVMLTYKFRKV